MTLCKHRVGQATDTGDKSQFFSEMENWRGQVGSGQDEVWFHQSVFLLWIMLSMPVFSPSWHKSLPPSPWSSPPQWSAGCRAPRPCGESSSKGDSWPRRCSPTPPRVRKSPRGKMASKEEEICTKRKSSELARKTLIAGRRFGPSGTSWSQSKRWSLPLVWWKVRSWRR